MSLDRRADFGCADKEELVAVALDGQPEWRVFEQELVGRFQSLPGQADRRGAAP
jgi:hypothetical protein